MTDELTPQERHDRLQDAWVALCQIRADREQDDYEVDVEEREREARHAVADVIGHYQANEGVEHAD